MTLDETRDALAEMDGWRQAFRHRHASGVEQWWWERDGGDESFDHPHPHTLDGADAAVTAAGFKWRRLHDAWIAVHHDRDTVVEVPNTGETPEHKIADLYALALACRKAMEKKR